MSAISHFTDLVEAAEYVDRAYEHEGESKAEFGMGAVSMGFDGNEAMSAYDGYRASEDPLVTEAKALLALACPVQPEVFQPPARPGQQPAPFEDDIPF